MRLTKQSNYAVRILMYCGTNEGQLSRIGDISASYGVSEQHMFKILQPLVTGGLVQSVRGRNGGICLARPANQITLLDVVRLTEDSFSMAECFDNDAAECPLMGGCMLNEALHKALDAFFDVLASYTIEDLIRPNPSIAMLLGIDRLSPRPVLPV